MSSSQLHERIAALRAEAAPWVRRWRTEAGEMDAEELFELAGELQGAINATEGAQLVATAHAASFETRLTDRGPVDVHHGLGFVDAMAASELSLETGIGQWAAGRRVGLAATAAERFPRLLGRILAGDLAAATVQKVVSVCDGLDLDACAAVEAVLVDRLADLDPARVTAVTRRVATRVAADQMSAAQRKSRSDRAVQVSPGPDGTTTWWAQLPADRSAAAWAAICSLGDDYADKDASLTADQARADAFVDLLLTNVTVSASVTLGIPVLTGPDADTARAAAHAILNPTPATWGDGRSAPDGTRVRRTGRNARSPKGGCGLGSDFSISTALSGCEIPGIGFLDADTIEALLVDRPPRGRPRPARRPHRHRGRDLSAAYKPPRAITQFVTTRDGTCRMWGCTRPARSCDTDHARPWPAGRPHRATSAPSVDATTGSSNAAAGPTSCIRTVPSPGPHPGAGDAPPCPTRQSGRPRHQTRMPCPKRTVCRTTSTRPPSERWRASGGTQVGLPTQVPPLAQASRYRRGSSFERGHSHSMVPGGLLVTSSTTRLTSRTSLVMRVEIFASTS